MLFIGQLPVTLTIKCLYKNI